MRRAVMNAAGALTEDGGATRSEHRTDVGGASRLAMPLDFHKATARRHASHNAPLFLSFVQFMKDRLQNPPGYRVTRNTAFARVFACIDLTLFGHKSFWTLIRDSGWGC
jgi:hypothetical protein